MVLYLTGEDWHPWSPVVVIGGVLPNVCVCVCDCAFEDWHPWSPVVVIDGVLPMVCVWLCLWGLVPLVMTSCGHWWCRVPLGSTKITSLLLSKWNRNEFHWAKASGCFSGKCIRPCVLIVCEAQLSYWACRQWGTSENWGQPLSGKGNTSLWYMTSILPELIVNSPGFWWFMKWEWIVIKLDNKTIWLHDRQMQRMTLILSHSYWNWAQLILVFVGCCECVMIPNTLRFC